MLGDGVRSAELLKEWRESCAKRGIPCRDLANQTRGRHNERPAQLRLIERADERIREWVGHGSGEAIGAAPIDGSLS